MTSQKPWSEQPITVLDGSSPLVQPALSIASRIPPGPAEEYDPSEDLLSWMSRQFDRYGNIYKATIHGSTAYVTRAPEYAQHVLRTNWQNYKKGQAIKRIALLLGNGLMVSEGEFWKKQRRMIHPVFHREAARALTDVITSANVALCKKWEAAANDRQSVNVTRDISLMILEVLLIAIFGDDRELAKPHFDLVSDESARNLEFAQAFRSLRKFVIELAGRRRSNNLRSTDILGMLMEARDRDSAQGMSEHELANEILTLVVAGHETTASTLNWAWYLISRHPQVEEKLSRELANLLVGDVPVFDELPKFNYTRQVLDEALRLYPAGWLMTRRARRDDQLGEYFVPAGTEVYISPYFIQRHPDLWEAPNQFNPDRFAAADKRDRPPLATLPFSAGPRNCIGEFLARTEMQIHIMTIAKRLRLRYPDSRLPEWEAGVNLRSKHDFIMIPEINTPAKG